MLLSLASAAGRFVFHRRFVLIMARYRSVPQATTQEILVPGEKICVRHSQTVAVNDVMLKDTIILDSRHGSKFAYSPNLSISTLFFEERKKNLTAQR